MANKAEIQRAILEVAGNPESGIVFDWSEKFADAIVGLDSKVPLESDARDGGTSFNRPAKETRTTKPEEN